MVAVMDLTLVGLQTVISHVEHLACEGLCHDGLATLSSRLCKATTGIQASIAHCVRSVWLLRLVRSILP